jgi:branched-chain amino acid transport system substrate-binding protein
LPDAHRSKKLATDFVNRYEKQFGEGSRNQFAAHGYDVALVLDRAVSQAQKKAKPGAPEFRTGLKDALKSGGGTPITQGVVTYTPTDHFGLQDEARMMLTVKNGAWQPVRP